jgi:hypothetical protein
MCALRAATAHVRLHLVINTPRFVVSQLSVPQTPQIDQIYYSRRIFGQKRSLHRHEPRIIIQNRGDRNGYFYLFVFEPIRSSQVSRRAEHVVIVSCARKCMKS